MIPKFKNQKRRALCAKHSKEVRKSWERSLERLAKQITQDLACQGKECGLH